MSNRRIEPLKGSLRSGGRARLLGKEEVDVLVAQQAGTDVDDEDDEDEEDE
jgi:hypothetical protein